MALTMSNATNARSSSGKSKLDSNLVGQLDKVISLMSGSKYDEMVKTIKNNWQGEDANDFLNDLNKTNNEIKTDIKKLRNKITETLNNDYSEFIKFQSKNKK